MALKVGGTVVIDDNRNCNLQRVEPGAFATASLPSAVAGDMVYDSTKKKLKVYDGSVWI